MDKATKAKFIDDIAATLNARYSKDNGETFFKGNALSYVMSDLRDKGWRKIPPMHFFADELETLGFKVVKARGKKSWSKNPKACGAVCNVVTNCLGDRNV